MKTTGKVLLALSCGAAAGAILGILYAPDKGSETRKKLAKKSHDLSDKVKEMKTTLSGNPNVSHKSSNGRTIVENEINELVS